MANKRNVQVKRNKTSRLCEHTSRIHRNCIRLNKKSINTLHEAWKFEICCELIERGLEFITEAKFESGGRADILVLDLNLAIEIVCSEDEESVEQKRGKYPVPILTFNVENLDLNGFWKKFSDHANSAAYH